MNAARLEFILVLAAASIALSATRAHANGWTLPKGEGRLIATAIYSNSGKGFDAEGDVVAMADYGKSELYLQTEYGLSDALTLIVTPSLRRVTIEGPGDDSFGLGYTDLGARYRLAQGKSHVLSLEGSVRIPGQKRRDNIAQIGSTDFEYDLRAQAGLSFALAGMQGFAIGEGGYRFRAGEPPNEYHADLTLGLRPAKKLLLLATSYNTWSDGVGRSGFPGYRYSNLYAGAVYDLSKRLSLQFGGLATLNGENALRERGVFGGVWLNF